MPSENLLIGLISVTEPLKEEMSSIEEFNELLFNGV